MYVQQWILFAMYQFSPTKFTGHALPELQIFRTTVTKILHDRLSLIAYTVQIMQTPEQNECYKSSDRAINILGSTCIKNFINVFTI